MTSHEACLKSFSFVSVWALKPVGCRFDDVWCKLSSVGNCELSQSAWNIAAMAVSNWGTEKIGTNHLSMCLPQSRPQCATGSWSTAVWDGISSGKLVSYVHGLVIHESWWSKLNVVRVAKYLRVNNSCHLRLILLRMRQYDVRHLPSETVYHLRLPNLYDWWLQLGYPSTCRARPNRQQRRRSSVGTWELNYSNRFDDCRNFNLFSNFHQN